MKNFKIVTKIRYCKASDLGDTRRIGLGKISIDSGADWKDLVFYVPAGMTIEGKYEDGVYIYTASLSFSTCEEFEKGVHYVFRLTTKDGTELLLGTEERPYNILTVSEKYPDKVYDAQIDSVTIKYTSNMPIPEIFDN